MKYYYRSRRSIVLGIGIWGFVIFVMSLSFKEGFTIQRVLSSPISSLSWFLVIFFLGGLWFGTGYLIKDQLLIIKIGPIVERKINIHSIDVIERSYDLLASPANALKRLRLNYRETFVLISPVSESEFIGRLMTINPDIVIRDLD